MTDTIEIVVNGRSHRIDRCDKITYERLCDLAEMSVEHQPTIVYSASPLLAGLIRAGETAPVKNHAVYNVARTGNA